MIVYVVTNPDLGWDCVVGVFDAEDISEEELKNEFPEDSGYVIADYRVKLSVED